MLRKSKITTTVFAGLAVVAALTVPTPSQATPLDLSGFAVLESVPGSVTELGGAITFTENPADAALYFYNDSFVVPTDAALLSFDYDFGLGSDDTDDYLVFNVNYVNQLTQTNDTIGGHYVYDLSGWRNQTVSLDRGLIWGGDKFAGTTAGIYNIDLLTSPNAPVPEPAAVLLMATGLAGLYGARRKKKS